MPRDEAYPTDGRIQSDGFHGIKAGGARAHLKAFPAR